MRESQADALRAEQGARLRELGVAASAMPGAFAPDPPPPPDASVRVLQWNVLAHGLSDDGFIVNTVLVRRRRRAAATATAPPRRRHRHRATAPPRRSLRAADIAPPPARQSQSFRACSPAQEGDGTAPAYATAAELAEAVSRARAAGDDMGPIISACATPSARRNHAAAVDWIARWARIREAVASLRPDIVVFEARLPPVSSPP